MSNIDLRRWLRREPRPAKLRVDGQLVHMPTEGNVWVKAEETILALDPSKVECLAADGTVLRALTFDDEGESTPAATPANDSSKSELVLVSKLLLEAYEKGATAHAASYQASFDKLVSLVEILAARLGGLETAWQKAMNVLAKAQADLATSNASPEGGGDMMDQAIGGLLARALTADATAGAQAANGAAKPNGKGAKS